MPLNERRRFLRLSLCLSLSLPLSLRARTSLHLFLRLRLDGKDLVKTRNAPAHAHKPITRKLVFLFRLKVCGGPYFLSLRLIHAHKKKKYLIAKKMGRRGGEGGGGGEGVGALFYYGKPAFLY